MPGSATIAPLSEQPPLRRPEPFDMPVRKKDRPSSLPEGFSETADEAVAAAEQAKMINERINKAVEQAKNTNNRIQAIDIPGNARMAEIKAQSADLLKQMEDLRLEIMTKGTANMDAEDIAAREQSISESIQALESDQQLRPSTAETKKAIPAAAEKSDFQKHLDSSNLELAEEPLDLAPEPYDAEADIRAAVSDMEPGPIQTPDELPPEAESHAVSADTPTESNSIQAAEANEFDRAITWKEVRGKIKHIDTIKEDWFKTKDQEKAVDERMRALKQELAATEKEHGSFEKLIDSIAEAHTILGGQAAGAQAREKLNAVIQAYRDGSSDLPSKLLSDLKSNFGAGGLQEQLNDAKKRASRSGLLKRMGTALQGLVVHTEVSGLEFIRNHHKKSIGDALDAIMNRLRKEHELAVLNARKNELTQEKEAQLQQIEYAQSLETQVAEAILAEGSAKLVKQRLTKLLETLPPAAARALRDLPETVAPEHHRLMSSQDRATYERLAANYHKHLNKFNALVDSLGDTAKNGIGGFERSGSTPYAETPTASEQASTDAEDTITERRERMRETWNTRTQEQITRILQKQYPEYISPDDVDGDVREFIMLHMPDDAQRIIFDIAKLQNALDEANTDEELDNIFSQKAALVDKLEHTLRTPDNIRNPDMVGLKNLIDRKKPGATTKPDIGTKTLSSEELENLEKDTISPDYAKQGFDTVAPEYAPDESLPSLPPTEAEWQDKTPDESLPALPPTEAELRSKAKEREQDREAVQAELKKLSAIFHAILGDMSHRELLPQAGTWDKLRSLDQIASNPDAIPFDDARAKTSFIRQLVELHNSLNETQFDLSFKTSDFLENKSGRIEVLNIAERLGVDMRSVLSNEPVAETAAPRRKPRRPAPPKPARPIRRPAKAA